MEVFELNNFYVKGWAKTKLSGRYWCTVADTHFSQECSSRVTSHFVCQCKRNQRFWGDNNPLCFGWGSFPEYIRDSCTTGCLWRTPRWLLGTYPSHTFSFTETSLHVDVSTPSMFSFEKLHFFSKLALSADQYLTLYVSLCLRFALPGTSWQADP